MIEIQIETQTKLTSIAQGAVYTKRAEESRKAAMYANMYNSLVTGVITRDYYVSAMGNFFKGKKL